MNTAAALTDTILAAWDTSVPPARRADHAASILSEMALGQRGLDHRDAAPLLAAGLIVALPERHVDRKCGYFARV